MRHARQTTLAAAVAVSGVALHSGAMARATLRPAVADRGVVFHVRDPAGATTMIEANAASIVDTRLCTRLGDGAGASIGTVEHLLAALSICGVDNVDIEIDADEMPILDGSAAPYVEAIERAGLASLAAPRRMITITQPIEVRDGDRSIRAEPADGRLLDVRIDFDDAAIASQTAILDLDDPADRALLARARTFCRLADVEAMRASGLSKGGSLDNAIVVDGARILNDGGLRDPREFVLHKALDLVGDLRLAGAPIVGRIHARRPGHDLNARFVRALSAGQGLPRGRPRTAVRIGDGA